MPVEAARIFVFVLTAYVVVGILVAPMLIFRGSGRFDRAVAASTRGFCFIVLPGAILLWPLLLRRFLAATGTPPIESNAHRDRAARQPAPSTTGTQ
jgi:hypothetical protein